MVSFRGEIGEMSEASSLVDVLWSDPFWWNLLVDGKMKGMDMYNSMRVLVKTKTYCHPSGLFSLANYYDLMQIV